jgi:hypothetical protein
VILLLSDSRVARVTGVSHQHLAAILLVFKNYILSIGLRM